MLAIYAEFSSQMAAIPVVAGRKSAAESFAGGCHYIYHRGNDVRPPRPAGKFLESSGACAISKDVSVRLL